MADVFTTMFFVGASALAATHVVKKVKKRSLRRHPFPKGRDLCGDVIRQIILARLVMGVYDDASKISASYEWWDRVHYSEVPCRDLFTENMNCQAGEHDVPTQEELDCEVKHKYFLVLRKKENSGIDGYGPKWVVAIRGTKLHRRHDLKQNFLLWSRQLHKSETSTLILKVVKRLCKLHGAENVCVAGHSLGAAYGMLVWRTLALEHKYFVACCLFSPPYGTAEAMLRYLGRVVVHRLHLPGGIGVCWNNLVQALEIRFGDPETQMQAGLDFEVLGGVSPYPELYINKSDFISEPFVKHFRYDESISGDGNVDFTGFRNWLDEGMWLRTRIWDDTQSFNRLPCANLHIATKPEGLRSSHKLSNWLRPDAVFDSKTITLVDR